MSKSLKNFITITAVLERTTARQLRLLFLNHMYNKPMTYSEDSLHEAAAIDRTLNEFFLSAKAKVGLDNLPHIVVVMSWGELSA